MALLVRLIPRVRADPGAPLGQIVLDMERRGVLQATSFGSFLQFKHSLDVFEQSLDGLIGRVSGLLLYFFLGVIKALHACTLSLRKGQGDLCCLSAPSAAARIHLLSHLLLHGESACFVTSPLITSAAPE
jgi:hypothetical protein